MPEPGPVVDGAGRDDWQGATGTFVAGADYYSTVAGALRAHVLPRVPAGARVLDVGCGDGTFTALLATRAAHVDAFDVAPALVAQARQRGLANVEFTVGDATTAPPGGYDLVSCMGVLVCLTDDASFRAALRAAAGAVAPGGSLLLRETLSGWGRRVVPRDGYTACYRTRRAYRSELGGFTLVHEEPLAVWSRAKRRANVLWLWERGAA